jgi:Helix-turn-helix
MTLQEYLAGRNRASKIELAHKIGVTETSLNRYVRGDRIPD